MVKCAKLKIFGKVQGVFYRDKAQEKAHELELVGWVKNMPDGTVEAIIQGKNEAIKQMIDWCHTGSSSSEVEKVEVTWQKFQEGDDAFEVLY